MNHCLEKNLKKLKSVMKKKRLFDEKLKNSVFLCTLEILYNICNRGKKEKKIMPKSIVKKLKKNKETLRFLFNKGNQLEERKKRFLGEEVKFKKLIVKVIRLFFDNCVVLYD